MTLQEKIAKLEAAGHTTLTPPWEVFRWKDGSNTQGCANVGCEGAEVTIVADAPEEECAFISLARNEWAVILGALREAVETLEYYAKEGSVGSHTSGHGESSDHIGFYYGLKKTPKQALETISQKIGAEK